jgi:hypothetical protein
VPESIAPPDQIVRVHTEVAQRAIDGMASDGTPFCGLLYVEGPNHSGLHLRLLFDSLGSNGLEMRGV